MRERPPLQQDRTPKIPTPPGVAGGEKSEPRPPVAPAGTASHGADTVSRVGGSASATTEKSAARPPVGSQRPREGGASTPGTAGTRPPIGGRQSHGGEVSSSSMAGTGTPAGSSTVSGVVSPFVGMAEGIRLPHPPCLPGRRRCFVGYGRKSPPHSRQLPEQPCRAPARNSRNGIRCRA